MDKTSASYTMTITKDEIISTDKRFTLNDPIPAVKISDLGLVSVADQKLLPLFV